MKKITFTFIASFIIIFNCNINILFSQIENVPVANSVYQYLIHAEGLGLLPHFSSSSLPLSKQEIVNALKQIRKQESTLSSNELASLEKFEIEFEIKNNNSKVVFFSESDSSSIFWSGFIENDNKHFYKYKNSVTSVYLTPLGSVESIISKNSDNTQKVLLGTLGARLNGTIDNCLGYYLQATNGTVFSGERAVALQDNKLKQNVKFTELNSDFDFTESHVRFAKDWFYASIGRETKLLGAGIDQRLFLSTNASPFDAISLGTKFLKFEYNYTFGSLISPYKDSLLNGFNATLADKYISIHRFTLKPSFGEISYWESIVYSNRKVELAYLNPLSFLKSLEHALHDRDNSLMGGDMILRPFSGFSIKGSFILDDIIFSDIGKGFWGNKTASNIGILYALPNGFDVGLEYSRVEPYTFTHFNYLNSYTNDNLLMGGDLYPNSDETTLLFNYWWGNRYPLTIKLSYVRHGENIYNSNDSLIFNAGADPLQSRRSEDSEKVTFLGGHRVNDIYFQIGSGWEIVRGFNLQAIYQLQIKYDRPINYLKIVFAFEDF